MPTSGLPTVDLIVFVIIGLLGGAHCIGMCGPLVSVYAERMDPTMTDGGTVSAQSNRSKHLSLFEVRQHALFNIGRTASYTIIGAVMGILGSVLFISSGQLVAATEVVRGVVGGVIGLVIIGVGIGYLRREGGIHWHLPGTTRVTRLLTKHVDRLANGPGILALGGIHGLLPCPLLYPAFLYAFASGSPLTGAAALGALGVGTIPAVFAFGTIIGSVSPTGRRRLHYLLGVAFVGLGYLLLAHGLIEVGVHLPHPELPYWSPFDGGHG